MRDDPEGPLIYGRVSECLWRAQAWEWRYLALAVVLRDDAFHEVDHTLPHGLARGHIVEISGETEVPFEDANVNCLAAGLSLCLPIFAGEECKDLGMRLNTAGVRQDKNKNTDSSEGGVQTSN